MARLAFLVASFSAVLSAPVTQQGIMTVEKEAVNAGHCGSCERYTPCLSGCGTNDKCRGECGEKHLTCLNDVLKCVEHAKEDDDGYHTVAAAWSTDFNDAGYHRIGSLGCDDMPNGCKGGNFECPKKDECSDGADVMQCRIKQAVAKVTCLVNTRNCQIATKACAARELEEAHPYATVKAAWSPKHGEKGYHRVNAWYKQVD